MCAGGEIERKQDRILTNQFQDVPFSAIDVSLLTDKQMNGFTSQYASYNLLICGPVFATWTA
jgi:hypothetical protein